MSGRSVVITGGSRGLGAGLVEAFLAAGDTVSTCSRSRSDLVDRWESDAGNAGRFSYTPVDLADREAVKAFVHAVVAERGRIDVLVNNAGMANDGVLATMADDDVDQVIDLNLRGTLTVTKAVVRRMLRQGDGRIVNVSSVVGLSGYRGLAVYSATKAALDGMTRALARELGSRGITVNSVAPGYVATEMSHGLTAEDLKQIVRRTPLGRLAEPADIADAVMFLVSPAAKFITGQVLVVDGGLTA
ncbi:MAG TPA: 3-oxoacyl-ACP reductase family protein [Mycobacteriales bacterium]|nr:3-oxoacyl-ACP reductase family protein [Mycobacteriales bacterium]